MSNENPPSPELIFKVATEDWELEQIHRLNYRTFVEEIPQHPPNPEGRLVDRFHAENTYLICLQGRRLVAMLAMRAKRPFSLDGKLPNVDAYLPKGRNPIEVRLLAVEPEFRKTIVFTQLFESVVRYCLTEGFDLAIISGTTRQAKLYRHLGFVPFGPLVGTEQASYQPMYLTIEAFGQTLERSAVLRNSFTESAPPDSQIFNFLPGPVTPAPEVRSVFAMTAVSHRGKMFLTRMAEVRQALCRMTGAPDVEVLLGSGSLANEVVAGQLSLLETTGLVLSNGEFGERLATNARRAGLRFDWMRLPWGQLFDITQVERFAERLPRGGWIWFVHHETSTGVLNPMPELKELGARLGLRLCADCISSIGAMPVDLRGMCLATTASGKGLGSFPGLSMVFHDYQPKPAPDRLPGYLDLGHWATNQSVPHTHSSNLLFALAEAVRLATINRMERIAENAAWFRRELKAQGFTIIAPEEVASPGIVTIALDGHTTAAELGEELEIRGYWLSYRSSYLLSKNWIQVSFLGNPERSSLEKLLHIIRVVCTRHSAQKQARTGTAQNQPA